MQIHPSQVLSGISFVVFFESRFFETQTSLYLDTFCLLYCVCVCLCVSGVSESGERREFISQLLSCIFPSTAFLCVVSVYVCVGRCVGVFMAPFLLTTSLHLPPSLPSSPSPSFLLNLSFHPVQTVCRCCPPLPLHHVCRNEIKP